MPAEKAEILHACAKAILTAHGNGEVNEKEKPQIKEGLELLISLVRDVASAEESIYLPQVQQALEDILLGTECSIAIIIRNLADAAVTLDQLHNGDRHPEEQKLMEAHAFCVNLRYEFRALSGRR